MAILASFYQKLKKIQQPFTSNVYILLKDISAKWGLIKIYISNSNKYTMKSICIIDIYTRWLQLLTNFKKLLYYKL